MSRSEPEREVARLEVAQCSDDLGEPIADDPSQLQPWELVDPDVGRYMPRRIRGSCRGRALG